ncbi:MAG: hypothetical protein ACYC23_06955 [Limisphaerales bacterium]
MVTTVTTVTKGRELETVGELLWPVLVADRAAGAVELLLLRFGGVLARQMAAVPWSYFCYVLAAFWRARWQR